MSRGIGGGALLLLKTLVLRSFQIVHVMSIVREDMDLRLGVAKKDILDHQDLRELYKTTKTKLTHTFRSENYTRPIFSLYIQHRE
jgi:hypothetical protein